MTTTMIRTKENRSALMERVEREPITTARLIAESHLVADLRIEQLEASLRDVLSMLRAHMMQCGTSGNPKTKARFDRAEAVLQAKDTAQAARTEDM